MSHLIRESYYIAQKDYDCDACVWMFETGCLQELGLKFSEYRDWVKAKNDNYKIKAGDTYIYQVIEDGGTIRIFKAIPAIHQICLKYEVYPDD